MRELIRASRHREANELVQRQLRILEATRSSDSLARGRVLELLVENAIRGTEAIRGPRRLNQALEAVRLKAGVLGADHLELAGTYMYLGRVYHRMNRLAEARAACERSLAIRRRALPPDHPDVATSLHNLARIEHAARDTARARALYLDAIAIRERVLGPDSHELAVSLSNLGQFNIELGEDAAARPLYERSLAIYRRTQPDHFNASEIHRRLAEIAGRADDYMGTRYHLEQAVGIRARTDLGLDNALEGLAAFLRQAGDYERARKLFEQVLEARIREGHAGTWHVGSAFHGLGVVQRDLGEYAESRRLLEQAATLHEKDLGPWHPSVAACLHELAMTRAVLNDDAAAQSALERALAIRRAKLPPDDPETARTLDALAALHLRADDREQARARAEEALAMLSRKLGSQHSSVAGALARVGQVELAEGDTATAGRQFERALRIVEAARGPDHIHVAAALDPVAEVLWASGRRDSARAVIERSLAIRRKGLGEDHPEVGDDLLRLARLHREAGELLPALDRSLAAERVRREHVRLTARTLPEEQALGYAALRSGALDEILALAERAAAADPEVAARVWDALVRSRALVVEEMAARRRRLPVAGDSATMQLAGDFLEARRRLAHLALRGASDTSDVARLLAAARRQSDAAEEALARHSAAFREGRARDRIGLEEIRAQLPERTALVGFVRYGHPASASGARYAAFVAEGRNPPRMVPLGLAEEVEHLVRSWRTHAARRPARARLAAEERLCRAAGELLRRRVWDPLGLDPSLERVFVVSDGGLLQINFLALPVGSDQYLAESGPLVHLLASERDLAGRPTRPVLEGELLAFGGADFDAPPTLSEPQGTLVAAAAIASEPAALRSTCSDVRSLRFAPLPATAEEARDVLRVWETRSRAAEQGPRPAIFLGRDASEAVFKQRAPRAGILHVATHGFFLTDSCSAPVPSARGIGGMVVAGVIAGKGGNIAVGNPLLASGLAFAGANRRGDQPTDQEDGILTAAEVAALDLSRVRWAVLSACETGLGEFRTGEGILGLRRAFQIAGVGALVTSLWAVEDESSRSWMRAFYDARLAAGLGTAEAVREASRSMLRTLRAANAPAHPFHWAGFVAVGDWD